MKQHLVFAGLHPTRLRSAVATLSVLAAPLQRPTGFFWVYFRLGGGGSELLGSHLPAD